MSATHILWLVFAATCFHLSSQKLPGEDCVNDSECVVEFDNEQRTIWCHNSLCVCREGYAKEGNRCEIGGDCVSDANCSRIENAFCNNRPRSKFYCACKDGYAKNANGTLCRLVLDSDCGSDSNCSSVENAFCDRETSKCRCKNGYMKDANDTSCSTGLGQQCKDASDCARFGISDLICRDKTCVCSDNTVAKPDRSGCISKAGHHGVCTESIQCSYSEKTRCYLGVCECVPTYRYNGQKCVGNIDLGKTCITDAECVVNGDLEQRTVYCFNGQCACRDGFIRSDDSRCVIGGDCERDSDCTKYLENSYCNTLKKDRYNCACSESFIPAINNTKCLPIVHEIGTGCEDTVQCTKKLGDAYCNDRNQCVCSEGVSLNKEKTCGRSSATMISAAISLSCLAVFSLVKIL